MAEFRLARFDKMPRVESFFTRTKPIISKAHRNVEGRMVQCCRAVRLLVGTGSRPNKVHRLGKGVEGPSNAQLLVSSTSGVGGLNVEAATALGVVPWE